MVVKKTSVVKGKIQDILLHYGPMDIIQLCNKIDSTPELIIGALQSIISHKEIIMAREEVNNRVVTWVAHPKTPAQKLHKISVRLKWSDKKSLLNLKRLRKQLINGSWEKNDNIREDRQLSVKKIMEKNFTVIKPNKDKEPLPLTVYKMLPEQNEPVNYTRAEKIKHQYSDYNDMEQNEPFQLDEFQQVAIEAVLNGNLVLVSAPTGTGKTLIAEKLAEQLLHNNLRMIYTSPLKALSNQKFRDFRKMFGIDKVGLVTGDVSINGSALLLVMTTEIFRNKCFGEPEELEGVGYVVFDEIHYLDDSARGTAWEESIIFAPPHVKILGLSATVPNVSELAGWIAYVRNSPVIVVEEKQRIVPLEIKWLTVDGEAVDQEEALKVIEDYLSNYYSQNDRPVQENYGRRRGRYIEIPR